MRSAKTDAEHLRVGYNFTSIYILYVFFLLLLVNDQDVSDGDAGCERGALVASCFLKIAQ